MNRANVTTLPWKFSGGSTSIRTRLILSFILIVLMPMAVISTVLTISNSVGGRQQAIERMTTVSNYKMDALLNWANSLKVELGNALIGDNVINSLRTLMRNPPDSPTYDRGRLAYVELRNSFLGLVSKAGRFDEVYVLNPKGVVVLSTNSSQEGQVYSNQPYFQRGLAGPYVNPPYYSRSANRTIVIAVYPVFENNGQLMAMIAGRAKSEPLYEIVENTNGLGETGLSYLIDVDQTLLAGLDESMLGKRILTDPATWAVRQRQDGSSEYLNIDNERVAGVYYWLPELQTVLFSEQSQLEYNRSTYAVLAVNVSVALAAILIASILSLSVTRSIAAPISSLAESAVQITSGKLVVPDEIDSQDEVGVLTRAFRRMTMELQELIGNLEKRVTQRTSELERRSGYLQGSAEVSQAAASILDPDQLIRQVVELIRERFDLYYTGLFLVDENRQWAVLRAGTGDAGQKMLARNHRLQISGRSMIGWCISNGQARIALLAGEDPVRLATAELPETRSEAALPLRSRGHILGAITVQSSQPNAFDADTIAVLQIMADQVAIALDNARLLKQSQAALDAERRAYGELSRSAWSQRMQGKSSIGIRGDKQGNLLPAAEWRPEMERAIREGHTVVENQTNRSAALAIPIKVRGVTIGVIDIPHPAQSGTWRAEEVSFLETIAEQLGVALDSARLYEETQKRAEREQMVGEVTARMRQTLDVDAVLQTATREIYRALGLQDVTITLEKTKSSTHAVQETGR